MINIPFEQIIEKIKKEKGISEDEIMSKIKAKMDKLSGLISKEGAAYIVANELGVKLIQPNESLKIKNILSGMRNVEFTGKVTRIFDVVNFERDGRKGKVMSFFVADETGQIRVTAWHDAVNMLSSLSQGDIVKISGAYVRENNGQKEVHLNERSKVIVNPPGITVDAKDFNARKRKLIVQLEDNEENVEVFATIVDIYDIRFFTVCPECGKRTTQKEDGLYCDVHGKVSLYYSYLLNLVLDDGTGNIRTVLFKNQVQRLLNKTNEEILVYVNEPEKFSDIKTSLLGEQIKIIGRVVTNERFERKEIIAQLVFTDVDAEEEMKSLEMLREKYMAENQADSKAEESKADEIIGTDAASQPATADARPALADIASEDTLEAADVEHNLKTPADDVVGDNVAEESIVMNADDEVKKDKDKKTGDVFGIDDL